VPCKRGCRKGREGLANRSLKALKVMETQKVGTEIKATYKESQWGGSSATFSQRVDTKQDARERANQKGWKRVEMEEVDEYEVV